MPTTTRSQRRRQPVRGNQTQQRRPSAQQQRELGPPDYSADYADVRRDLTLIAIISVLLFLGMVGLSFVL